MINLDSYITHAINSIIRVSNGLIKLCVVEKIFDEQNRFVILVSNLKQALEDFKNNKRRG